MIGFYKLLIFNFMKKHTKYLSVKILLFFTLITSSLFHSQAQYIDGPDIDGDLVFFIDSATHNENAYIDFVIRVDSGKWQTDIYSFAVRHNRSVHKTTLNSVTGNENNFTLDISVEIPGDEWGFFYMTGDYTINMTRNNNHLNGNFTGSVEGKVSSTDPLIPYDKSGPVLGEYYTSKLPSEVKDWNPITPGEHPRLFFRTEDLPALRTKSQTAEGQVIMNKLENMLTNLPYSLWDGAGYGFLYQMTENTDYADSAKKCVEMAFNGTPDKDSRYAWVGSASSEFGALRAGPSLAAIAMAYDLCYDAWPTNFREDVAYKIAHYKGSPDDENTWLEDMAFDPRHQPGSNHWGAIVGGAGIAVLSVINDPGTNYDTLSLYLKNIRRSALRNLLQGFGDGGYFAEHSGPSHVSSNTAFVPYLQAEYYAGGKDFLSPRPNARWITLRWAYELISTSTGAQYPIRHSSSYGTKNYEEDDLSHGGQFAQGMGTLTDSQKLAMTWVYDSVVKPNGSEEHIYGIGTYPHRAMFALVNWPLGQTNLNPEGIIPRIMRDSIYGYYAFRKQWKDTNDIIITALADFNKRWGNGGKDGADETMMFWGYGLQGFAPATFFMERTLYYEPHENGSGVVSNIPVTEGIETRPIAGAEISSFAVDFYDDLTGAKALVVAVGPKADGNTGYERSGGNQGAFTELTSVTTDNYTYQVMTLQTDTVPNIISVDDTVVVNKRSVYFDGLKLVMGTKEVTVQNSENLYQDILSDIELYPNPVTDILTINTNQENVISIDFINSAGQIVETKYISGETLITLNTSRWRKGFYYARFTTDKGLISSLKFIKE